MNITRTRIGLAVLGLIALVSISDAQINAYVRFRSGEGVQDAVVTLRRQSDSVMLSSAVTNSAGLGVLGDDHPGVNKCLYAEKQGHVIYSGTSELTFEGSLTPICQMVFSDHYFYSGKYIDGLNLRLTGARGYLNPNAGDMAEIILHPKTGAVVRLEIYDLHGRKIWETERSVQGGIQSVVRWPATNSRGEKVASGIYLIRVREGLSGVLTRKIAVVRN